MALAAVKTKRIKSIRPGDWMSSLRNSAIVILKRGRVDRWMIVAMATDGEVLVPPLNFATVERGVHRSGFPNKKNFPFMDTLNLRYLSTDEYKRDTYEWAQAKGLHIFHLRIDSCLDLDGEDAIASALESILVLIHDNKGRILPSVLSALLRLLQRWSFTAVLAEYRAFLPDEKIWPEVY
ncbi:hypothetical protein RQP46_006394 [Phenoliferia psychrophenolica]